MQRVPRAANAVLVLVVATCLSGVPAAAPPFAAIARAAAVLWAPSSLVVSEVQTGGAGASDEFVEIANQGAAPVDLVGLELVYATSSGTTVTRKATWTASTILAPGRRFLVVNGAGAFASIGDAAYTGGFAAAGGAVALRLVGGSVVDAIAWGDATNAFVEGSAAPAPGAGSSLERRPGGALGNDVDNNDNLTDWLTSTAPAPQGLAAPPVPDPGTPTATPTPTPLVSPEPSATVAPEPTPTASAEPTPVATPSEEPTPTPVPTPTPSAEPTPTPTGSPPTPTPTPSPEPTPAPMAIADARSLTDGSLVTVSGVLTTELGALEAGRTAFVQDATGGIALYLDAPVVGSLPLGTIVVARGSIDDRFAQRTLRAAEADVIAAGVAPLPPARDVATGAAVEGVEGSRVRLTGTVTEGPDALADGTAVTIDDGTGPIRVIVTPPALGSRVLTVGSTVAATGPLGQRDSSGTGIEGYRSYVTIAADLAIEAPPPSPTPTATATPSPTSSPTPQPTPSPTASPGASQSPSPSGSTIASVRGRTIGSIVTVHGVVTAEAGRLGSRSLIAIGDATGGIVVKVPSGVPAPSRGRAVTVTGPLADPYGQLELRPAASGLVMGGSEALPAAIDLGSSGPSESNEGRLVRTTGVVVARPSIATSGDVSLTIETATGTRIRVMADSSSGVSRTTLSRGARYRITGIVGQRAPKKDEPDGYRVWVRDRRDVSLLAAAPTSKPSPTRPGSSGAPAVISIAAALRVRDRAVSLEATVTAAASLLDSSGRRIVVQDPSGAIEVLLPKDTNAPGLGARLRLTGTIGTAYGAPRLRATHMDRRGSATVPAPLRLAGPITAAHTWRLVAISGRVDEVRKLGERWRAEIVIGRSRLVVVGQPGTRIPATALAEGRAADVIGIVRPAYPSATDKRPSVLPRSAADVRSGAATGSAVAPAKSGSAAGALASGRAASVDTAADADLVDLTNLIGSVVRVGGLVVQRVDRGFTLDDGTSTGQVELDGPATEWLDLIEPGDAINVTGRVVPGPDGDSVVVVHDPAAIVLGSALDGLEDPSDPTDEVEAGGSALPSDIQAAGFGAAHGIPGAGAGIAGLLSVSVVSLIVTVLRRRRHGGLFARRIVARVVSIGDSAAATRRPIHRHPPT